MKIDCTLKSFVFVLCLFLSSFQFGFSNGDDTFCFNANLPADEVAFFMDDCNTAPLMVCASTYFGCPSDSVDPSTTGQTTATPGDADCPQPDLSYEDTVMVDTGCELTIKRIWTAIYPNNSSPWLFSTCTQMLFLTDDAPTVSNCPTDQTIDLSTNGCNSTATWALPSWDDDCGLQSVSSSAQPGDEFPLGTTTVTYLAIDFCGNSASCEFTVTVVGSCCEGNPVITCPSDYTACPGGSQSPTVTGTATAVSSDDCDPAIITFADVTVSNDPCNTQIARTWTATYPGTTQSSSCTQTLTYSDPSGPTIIGMPSNINLSASGNNCSALASWTQPTATDNCGTVNLTSTHTSGSSFNEGTTTVTYTATDGCGNSSTASFTVTVTCACTTPPTITCPVDITDCPFSSTDPTSTGTATALAGNSICGTPTVIYNDVIIVAQNSCGEVTIERTWTATDPNDASLTASCTQTITHVDNTDPILNNVPGSVVLTAPQSNCNAVATWTPPTTSDNCSAVELTSTHTSGSTFSNGITTVTYTATDDCGNSVTGSFTVTVNCECDTPPSIACPADVTDCPGGSISPSVTGTAEATNLSGCGTPLVTFVDNVTVPANDCGETTIVRTWTATDSNNSALTSSCNQVITHVDDTNPVITGIPTDIFITLTGSGCSSIATWTIPTASDNCTAVNLTSTHDSGDTFTEGTTTVTYTASDACANVVSDSFTVTVECLCNDAPIIDCPSNYFGCVGGSQDPSITGQATATSTPGCGNNIELTFTDSFLQNTSCIKEIIRVWTATDLDNGLSSTCSQFLGLYDTQVPVFNTAPTDIVITGGGNGCNAIGTWSEPNVTDDCGLATVTSTHTSGSTFSEGTTTVVYTAVDNCGKTTTYSFTVTVECECTTPVTINCPSNYFGCIGNTDPSVTGTPTFTEEPGCGPYELTFNDIMITDSSCAVEIARIWTVTDLTSGTNSVCSQFIGLYDTQLPTITNGPTDISVEGVGKGCAEVVTWTIPTATDDCGIASFTSTHQSGDTFPEGNTIVVYTAVDNCGKTTTYSFNVIVDCSCSVTPLVQCPSNYFGCIGDSLDSSNTGTATFNTVDGCGPVELTSSDNVITDNGCTYEVVRTWTTLDTSSGLTSSCAQFLGLYDMQAPSLASVPGNIVLEANGSNCSAIATWTAPTATDNCGEVTLTSNIASGSSFNEGQTTVTYTATDGCGRTTTASFVVTVNCVCNVPPSISCPQDYIACPGSDTTPATTGTALGTAQDGCDAPIVTFADTSVNNGCGVTITRVWTATDPNQSTLVASCTQTITLSDTEAPTIVNCPHDVTIDGGGICSKPFLWFEPTATDNCSEPVITTNIDNGSTFNEGTTEVIYTATDDCGNASTCSFEVTILCDNCNTPPLLTCPSDVTVCIGDDMLPSGTGTATAESGSTDCTTAPTVTFNDVMITNGPCNGAMVIERTWTATDASTGLTSTCTQMVSSEDNTAPTFTNVPENIVLAGDASNCSAIATWTAPTVTDDCTAITLTSTHQSGDTFTEGTVNVIYTAEDACGNTSTAAFTVTLACDCTLAPSITCPDNYNGCAGSSTDPSITGTALASASAGCNTPSVTFSDAIITAGNSCGETTIERTWTATDPNNSGLTASCVQTLTLSDNTAPVFLTVPDNIEVDAPASDCFVPVTWATPTYSDNCTAVTLTSTAQSGDTFGEAGVYTVTYTATDACGNVANASFTITVTCLCDEVPVIACPSDYTACPNTSTDPSVTGTATAIPGWACGDPTVTFSDVITTPMNSCGEVTISRTWSATDTYDTSLTTTCVQVITLVDSTPPTITNVPVDITVSAPSSNCFVPVTWDEPTIADGCGSSTIVSNYTSGDVFGDAGVYTVTYTATDACGNVATADFTVTVICTCDIAPIIVCPDDYNACPGSSTVPDVTGNAFANYATECTAPTITFADNVTSPMNSCGETTIARTWTATDVNDPNLTSSCTQMITLIDNESPMLVNVPTNVTVDGGNGPACDISYTWTAPTATDNCTSGVTVTADQTNGSIFPMGVTVVTFTATDACGNTATASFEINVVCTSGSNCISMPAISCPADFSACVGADYQPTVTGMAVGTAGNTNCNEPNVTYTDVIVATGDCTGSKTIERTWTATDPFNTTLSASCIQTITLNDTSAPVLSNCPSDITVTGGADCDAVVNWIAPTTLDNCSSVTLTSNFASGSAFWEGTTTVTYTASDACGNTSSCSFDVLVECPSNACDTPPTLTCPGDAILCIGSSIAPSILGQPIVNGNADCPTPSVTFSDFILSTGPCTGAKVIDRVWTANYPGTNLSTSCTQSIVIADEAKPFIQGCPANITVDNQMTIVNWTAPTVIDNCGVASFTSSHNSGTYFPVGITTVVYTAVDNCGNTEFCSFTVTVEDTMLNPLTCPADIIVGCDSDGGANVTWTAPTYDSGCNPCTGTTIPGFIFMGSYNGHQYYCSTAPATWQNAQAVASSNGGYLAIVNDASENAFLANLLTIQSAYIGLSDHITEGQFQWVDGSPVTYTNWYAGQPNDFNQNQDYVEMLNNGEWNDQYNYSPLEYIMEVPCSGIVQTAGPTPGNYLPTGSYTVEYTVFDGCNDGVACSFDITVEPSLSIECPEDVTLTSTNNSMVVNWQTPTASSCCSNCSNGGTIPGYIYMGNHNGHNYYCSNSPLTWLNAQDACSDQGGYLAVINDAEENAFLSNILTIQSAYIGLSDHVNEGQFQWVNGESSSYTNWFAGQPNNYNNQQDFCEMMNDGTWNDQYNYKALEYIMEVPGCINVTQTSGPASGSIFTAGTTTAVSYTATDQCGNVDVCTFNITVENAGCASGGLNSEKTWIDGVKFGNLSNESGNNGGYADFTESQECLNVTPGNSYHLNLEPGFTSGFSVPVYWSAWIDYNMDGDYTDPNEFIAYGAGTQTLSGVITMPSVLWNGLTTMRVAMKTGGYPTSPCQQYNYGETEDYCVEVYGAGDLTDGDVETRASGLDAILLEGELVEAASLTVYPSPATSLLNMDLTIPSDVSIETAAIYNLQGQTIRTLNPIDNTIPAVNVSEITNGIYLVKVALSDGSLLNEKIVVKH